MIRNAVDHGLETPEVRAGRGKPPVGRITLSARHETGSIVIEDVIRRRAEADEALAAETGRHSDRDYERS